MFPSFWAFTCAPCHINGLPCQTRPEGSIAKWYPMSPHRPPSRRRCDFRIVSNREAAEYFEVDVKGVIPSWWMVMYLTGNMRFMLPGIGWPFAHVEREIAPKVTRASGKDADWVVNANSGGGDADQMGLGRADVTFLVPHPTNVNAVTKRNDRLASRPWLVLVCGDSGFVKNIKSLNKSVSSRRGFCLQKRWNDVLYMDINGGIIGAEKV